jgi:Uma2 family endonuclease
MATPEQQRKPTEWEYRPEEIVATDVSYEDYLANYAEDFHEWDNGVVVKKSPVQKRHAQLTAYLLRLFEAYFELRPIGEVIGAPFVMRLAAQKYSPEPDLQVILNSNPNAFKSTMMDGPADICIEIISPDSVQRDRVRKLAAYEAAGVPEYWIFDHLQQEALFYRLNAEGHYELQSPDADGNYQTPLLPGFVLHVPTLWEEKLPGTITVAQAVQAMLAENNTHADENGKS